MTSFTFFKSNLKCVSILQQTTIKSECVVHPHSQQDDESRNICNVVPQTCVYDNVMMNEFDRKTQQRVS